MIDILPNWHPVFVHFTVALLPTAAVLFAASSLTRTRPWSGRVLTAARINLWCGVVVSLLTVAAGFFALSHSVHTDSQLAVAQIHRRAALVTVLIWWGLALWDWRIVAKGLRPHLFFVLLALSALLPLARTGWLGAELVFRHAVGVQQPAM
jgi:uncharacterized membrane protein